MFFCWLAARIQLLSFYFKWIPSHEGWETHFHLLPLLVCMWLDWEANKGAVVFYNSRAWNKLQNDAKWQDGKQLWWGAFLDKLGNSRCATVVLHYSWWFQILFYFHPENWGRCPFWLIFFRRVGSTTNPLTFKWSIFRYSKQQLRHPKSSQFEGSWGGMCGSRIIQRFGQGMVIIQNGRGVGFYAHYKNSRFSRWDDYSRYIYFYQLFDPSTYEVPGSYSPCLTKPYPFSKVAWQHCCVFRPKDMTGM